ncbi:MAG: DUF1993 domain-containing protein [Cyanobacteria bacterium J06626_6]
MRSQAISSAQTLFQSRLATLEHLLRSAQTYFEESESFFDESESFLQMRIVADMLPFGTQIAFTCNQPRNFALWCDGKPADNLAPEVTSLRQAHEYLANTQALLSNINPDAIKVTGTTRVDLGKGAYLELTDGAYVNDFLIPNFYFHLVTAYDILRMAGVPLGKKDYMLHLVPHIKTA